MSFGLAPVIVDRLINIIGNVRDKGIRSLLIAQCTQLALDVADRCYVIAQGMMKFNGAPDALKADNSILERMYLGA